MADDTRIRGFIVVCQQLRCPQGVRAEDPTRRRGIIIFDSGGLKIFNNEIGGSNWHGLKLAQDQRRQADGKYLEGRDPRYLNQVEDMGQDKTTYQWAAKPVPQDVADATGCRPRPNCWEHVIED